MAKKLSRDEGIALTATTIGVGALYWQRAAFNDLEGKHFIFFGGALLALGGITYFFRRKWWPGNPNTGGGSTNK